MALAEDVPGWQRQEYSDLRAALIDLRMHCPDLWDTANKAYQQGWPAPEVAWSAQRAWAQHTPHLFDKILRNHAESSYNKLRERLYGGT